MSYVPLPQAGEYGAYTWDYIRRVPPNSDVLLHLTTSIQAVREVVDLIAPSWQNHSFDPGEWTVKEILVHMMDTERVFSYRALRIARGDSTELPGFDQDAYVPHSKANERSLESIFAEYEAVRASTLALLESLPISTYSNMGKASGNPLSLRAAIYIIAGHELHHLESIKANYVGRQRTKPV